MPYQLKLAVLHRSGCSSPMKTERYTFDFVVNGRSLFGATDASSLDLCGCLSDPQREPEFALRLNGTVARLLTSDIPNGGSKRVALFVCPECGDVACGAITARVSRNDDIVQWSGFAYENGYESEAALSDVGPYAFNWAAYLNEIEQACAR
ncbi:hypothetical protein IVA79_11535 [Bradyrhizobium sp. 138]|uniref:hypothetical protein n=1 Tax=Bradyrhizobium sp. 138 TaxID=2782615 RepID=UPI001FFA96FD|nr:hypothetical protein [Bradyrhizobium sp. 138]MCK1734571.1 hypothetical protein [Bradyrhizobium sp. 138]